MENSECQIAKVQEISDFETVNRYLTAGWKFLGFYAAVFNTEPRYCLGWPASLPADHPKYEYDPGDLSDSL